MNDHRTGTRGQAAGCRQEIAISYIPHFIPERASQNLNRKYVFYSPLGITVIVVLLVSLREATDYLKSHHKER